MIPPKQRRLINGFRDLGNRSASDLRTFLPVSRLGVAALLRDFFNPFGHDLAVATGPRASDDDGNPRDKLLRAVSAINCLHLCEAAIDKQFRSRDVTAVIGREKHHSLRNLIGCAEPA